VAASRAALLGARVAAPHLPAALAAAAAATRAATDAINMLADAKSPAPMCSAALVSLAARLSPAALSALSPAPRRALLAAAACGLAAAAAVPSDAAFSASGEAAAIAGGALLVAAFCDCASDAAAEDAAAVLSLVLRAAPQMQPRSAAANATAEVIAAALARACADAAAAADACVDVPEPPSALLACALVLLTSWSVASNTAACAPVAPQRRRRGSWGGAASDADGGSAAAPLRVLVAGGRAACEWLLAAPGWRDALLGCVASAAAPRRAPATDVVAVLAVQLLRVMMAKAASPRDIATPLLAALAAQSPERHLDGGADAATAASACVAAAQARAAGGGVDPLRVAGGAGAQNAWNPRDCAPTLSLSVGGRVVTDPVGNRSAPAGVVSTSGNANGMVRARHGWRVGVHFWTVTLQRCGTDGSGYHSIGIAAADVPRVGGAGVRDASRLLGYHPRAWGLHTCSMTLLHAGDEHTLPLGRSCEAGDVIGFLLDLDVGTLALFLNGTRMGPAVRYPALRRPAKPLFPAVEMGCLRNDNVYAANFTAAPPPCAGAAAIAAVAATRRRLSGGGDAVALAAALCDTGGALTPRAAVAAALAAAPAAAGVADALGAGLAALLAALRGSSDEAAAPPASSWAAPLALLCGASGTALTPHAAATAVALLRRADAQSSLLEAAALALAPQPSGQAGVQARAAADGDDALAHARAAALRARIAKTLYELSADAGFAAAAAASPVFAALLAAADPPTARSQLSLGELAARAAALAPLANDARPTSAAASGPEPEAARREWPALPPPRPMPPPPRLRLLSQHAHPLAPRASYASWRSMIGVRSGYTCDICHQGGFPSNLSGVRCIRGCDWDCCDACAAAADEERAASTDAFAAVVSALGLPAAPASPAGALTAAHAAGVRPPPVRAAPVAAVATGSGAAATDASDDDESGAAAETSPTMITLCDADDGADNTASAVPSMAEARVLLREAEDASTAAYARLAVMRIVSGAPAVAAGHPALTASAFVAAAAPDARELTPTRGADAALAAWRDALAAPAREALSVQLATAVALAALAAAGVAVASSSDGAASASLLPSAQLRAGFGICVESACHAPAPTRQALIRRLEVKGAAALVVVFDPRCAMPDTPQEGSWLAFLAGSAPEKSPLLVARTPSPLEAPPAGAPPPLRVCGGGVGVDCWATPLVVPGDALWWRAQVPGADAQNAFGYAFTVWALFSSDDAGGAAAAAPRFAVRSSALAQSDAQDLSDGGEVWRLLGAGGAPWRGALHMLLQQRSGRSAAHGITLGDTGANSTMAEQGGAPFGVRAVRDHDTQRPSCTAALAARPEVRAMPAPTAGPAPPAMLSAGLHVSLPADAASGMYILYDKPYDHATTWEDIALPEGAFPDTPRDALRVLVGVLAPVDVAGAVDEEQFAVAAVAPLAVALAGGTHGGVAWRWERGAALAVASVGQREPELCWRLDGGRDVAAASQGRKFVAVFAAPGARGNSSGSVCGLGSVAARGAAAAKAAWLTGALREGDAAWRVPAAHAGMLASALAAALSVPDLPRAAGAALLRAAAALRWHDAQPAARAAAAAQLAGAATAACGELAPGNKPPATRLQVSRRLAALLDAAVAAAEPLSSALPLPRCPAPHVLTRTRQLSEALAAFETRAPLPAWLQAKPPPAVASAGAGAAAGEQAVVSDAPPCGIHFCLPVGCAEGLRQLYDEPYEHATHMCNVRLPPGCTDTHVLVAGSPEGADVFELCAVGRAENALRVTPFALRDDACATRDGEDGAFWYCVPGTAFGFAPSREITLNVADADDRDAEQRLSWHLSRPAPGSDNEQSSDSEEDNRGGGYRCGDLRGFADTRAHRKYIFSFTPAAEAGAASGAGASARGSASGSAGAAECRDDAAGAANALWSAELDAQLVRLAATLTEDAQEAAAALSRAAAANATLLGAVAPASLFPRAPAPETMRLQSVMSHRLPSGLRALDATTSEVAAAAATAAVATAVAASAAVDASSDSSAVDSSAVDSSASQPLLPLSERPAGALAARFALLQRFNALAAQCLHLVRFDGCGEDDDEDAAAAAISADVASVAAAPISLGARLLAAKGRLFPEVAAALVARSGALAATQGSAAASRCPSVVVQRGSALRAAERCGAGDGALTVFGQLFKQLEAQAARWSACSGEGERLWHVRLEGEGAMDAGGPFRESLKDLAAELCPEPLPPGAAAAADSAAVLRSRNVLRLFAPSPNATAGQDALFTDAFLPRAGRLDELQTRQLRFVGSLLGACMRSGNVAELTLPPLLWKQLLREKVGLHDLATADILEARRIAKLRCCQAEVDWPSPAPTWSRVDADGVLRALLRGRSAAQPVAFAERDAYCAAALHAALSARAPAVAALRAGLETVVPRAALAPLSWRRLERGATGSTRVTYAGLRAAATSRVSGSDEKYENWLFAILEAATDADRAKFLAFSSGRSRLPASVRGATAGAAAQPVLLIDMGGASEAAAQLPTASTCANAFHIARAPSRDVMRRQLMTAIYSCRDIDADTTNAAGNMFGLADAAEETAAASGSGAVTDVAAADAAVEPPADAAEADDGPDFVLLLGRPVELEERDDVEEEEEEGAGASVDDGADGGGQSGDEEDANDARLLFGEGGEEALMAAMLANAEA
jgi:hypothetical protein